MFFLAGLAARNLTRNLRRTVITSVAVVFGVAVMILGFGVVDGLDENVIRAASTTTTGDLLLRPAHYPTDGLTWPAEEAQLVPAELSTAIAAHGVATGRVVFSGRAVHGAEGVADVDIAQFGERLGQLLRHHSEQHVRRATGRERNDDANRAVRKVERCAATRRHGHAQCEQEK